MSSPQSNNTANCFIGRCKCGGIVFAAVDEPKYRNDNAKEVADLIRKGFAIETRPVADARNERWCSDSRTHMAALKEAQP